MSDEQNKKDFVLNNLIEDKNQQDTSTMWECDGCNKNIFKIDGPICLNCQSQNFIPNQARLKLWYHFLIENELAKRTINRDGLVVWVGDDISFLEECHACGQPIKG